MTRILAIDDSPTQAAQLELILDGAGYEVTVAQDAESALENLFTHRHDLIISDILMPGMSGYDLCRRIKADPGMRHIPVILLTSLNDPLDIVQGLEAGADNFINKPYEPVELLERLTAFFTNRRMRAEGELQAGVDVFFLGRKFTISSDRTQILDLLLATFESLVRNNHAVVESERELARAKATVEEYAKRLEERVQASESKYGTLMEHAGDAILVLDSRGVVLEANRQAEKLLGMEEDSIIARQCDDLGLTDTSTTGERELLRADGTTIWIDLSSSLVDVGGSALRVTIMRDVSEQRRARAQLVISDRLASVGMLAAGIAHEINNPLASIMANLDLAVRDVASVDRTPQARVPLEQLAEELADAREAAARVRQIVRDVKVFSHTHDEGRDLVDVREVLDSSLRMAQNEIRHRARLIRDYEEPFPVEASESRLGQVFLNLVVNAAQAIAEGHADQNEIRVHTGIDGRGQVVVDIADTGPGIPPEVKKNLFTPFFTTKARGEGTGLGLSICQRIVGSLGGNIHVDSVMGKGTLFRVTLPAARGTPIASGTMRSTPAVALRRGRVLIIDDEPMVASAVRRTLSGEHEVVAARSAQDALDRIGDGEDFDVILCDLMMPEISGMEFHALVAEQAPDLLDKIVFMSGGAFTARARAFFDECTNPRLEKPFDTDELRALINLQVR